MSICLHASRIKLPRGESLKCASVEKLKISLLGFLLGWLFYSHMPAYLDFYTEICGKIEP